MLWWILMGYLFGHFILGFVWAIFKAVYWIFLAFVYIVKSIAGERRKDFYEKYFEQALVERKRRSKWVDKIFKFLLILYWFGFTLAIIGILTFLTYAGFKEHKTSFSNYLMGLTIILGIVLIFRMKEIMIKYWREIRNAGKSA